MINANISIVVQHNLSVFTGVVGSGGGFCERKHKAFDLGVLDMIIRLSKSYCFGWGFGLL